MKFSGYQIRECTNKSCNLRYPMIYDHPFGESCPRCGSITRLMLSNSLKKARTNRSEISNRIHLEALLDNIRSAWNVGSMFRTADGVRVDHMYLCGLTATPQDSKVIKTSLGAEKAVPWSYHNNGLKKIQQLKDMGRCIWVLENNPDSEPLFRIDVRIWEKPIVLVVGNEIYGVDPEIIDQCDRIIYLPMQGEKHSYNVAVSFGIAVYSLRYLSQVQSSRPH